MSGVLSKVPDLLDVSSSGFTAAARDLGEVIAILSGGVRPDPDTLSRLCLSMRVLQRFLVDEAEEQAGREAIFAAARMLEDLGLVRVEVHAA